MLVGGSVCPYITSKTDYIAIPLRLGFGDPLVFMKTEDRTLRHVKYSSQFTFLSCDIPLK
jgi:hypothetical protein